MKAPLQPLADIDETAIRERVTSLITRLKTNDDLAEMYTEIRGHVAVKYARLAEELTFENTFLKAVEAHFERTLTEANSKRLPAEAFHITLEAKTEKQYDAAKLYNELSNVLPEGEFRDAVFPKTAYETNGTKLNKLVRSYGEDSPVGKIIAANRTEVAKGRPKLTIERKASAIETVR